MQYKQETAEHKIHDKQNYSFILKCLLGLATAAVITAGIITALALKTTNATLGAAATKGLFVSASLLSPAGALVGFLALTFIACTLALLVFSPTRVSVYRNSWGGWFFPDFRSTCFSPSFSSSSSYPSWRGGHVHRHATPSSHVHTHPPAMGGHVHGHPSGAASHVHSHPGGSSGPMGAHTTVHHHR